MNNLEHIISKKIKFLFCPTLLSPVDYWKYHRQEQLHRKSWGGVFILLNLIIIIVSVWIFFLLSDLIIKLFLVIFALFCLGDLTRTIFSASEKLWWAFLFFAAIISTLLVIALAIWANNYMILIITFFPINHLIALVRSRQLIQ